MENNAKQPNQTLKRNTFSCTDRLGSTCVFKAMEISSGSHGDP